MDENLNENLIEKQEPTEPEVSGNEAPRRGWWRLWCGCRKMEKDGENTEPATGCHLGCTSEPCLCREVFSWFGFLFLTFASGWLTGLFMQAGSHEWYATLTLPAWNPPGWVFMPVWLVLYFLLGTSTWLAWREGGCRNIPHILTLFTLLLLLQMSWGYNFYYHQNLFAGMMSTVWSLVVLILLGISTYPVTKTGAFLLLPEALWLTYAFVINYTLWKLN